MAHQPMGGGGIDVDMITGRPRISDPAAQLSKVASRYHDAIEEAGALAAELQTSPVLKILLDRYQNRLMCLADQDPECQALTSIISIMRHKLEVAPLEAEKLVRRVMGPQISSLIAQEEVQAAP